MPNTFFTRRSVILIGLIALAPTSPWAYQKQEPISINPDGIKDVRGLVLEMKRKAGPLFPTNLKAKDFYREILGAAVTNARRAADLGIKVPKAILKMAESQAEKWHMTKVQIPPMIIFPIFGVFFAMPMGAFFVIILASMWILMDVVGSKSKKEEAPLSPIQKQSGYEGGLPKRSI